MAEQSDVQTSEGAASAFRVRFSGAEGYLSKSPAEFWSRIQQWRGGPWEPSPAEALLHTIFVQSLERRLKAVFAAYVEETVKDLNLRILESRYGSLDLLFGVAALKTFVDLVAKIGPDVCLGLISTCATEAFTETFQADPGIASASLVSEVKARIDAQGRTAAKPKAGWTGVLNSAMGVMWLVPTLLALAVMLVAFTALMSWSSVLDQRQKDLVVRQDKHYESYDRRIEKLEVSNAALVAQVSLFAEKVALRLTQENTDKATDAGNLCCCPTCCAAQSPRKPVSTPPRTPLCK